MKNKLWSSFVFKKGVVILCWPLSFNISRQSFFFCSYKNNVTIPHFFKKYSGKIVDINEKKTIFYDERKILERGKDVKYTLTSNVYNIDEKSFYKKLIRTYVDILLNSYKYPLHVQCLHILSMNLLKEKIRNVTQSKEHKRKNFDEIYNEYDVEDLNKFLVFINNLLSTNNYHDMIINNNIENIIKKINNFLNYKNVLYALFTLEHNKIIFQYAENVLINELQNCFINSYLNKNKDIYRFINKYGHDNIYIYIIEYAENLNILKKRFALVKNLFFNKEMEQPR
ncbi:conserved Plasmodium protein, unknown function [Plasmodium gaboni]|uniref:Uncharacterized protein n=1 Tax=Plasmodium gaboni TaxID=647221 RepID=A0ABY1UI50_9APIC|nr:conserved Plasmodium protein, unknown function [Plasmodium gaboni]